MALQRVSIDVAGVERVERAFEAEAREVEDMRAPLREIRDLLREVVGRQFQSEGAYATGKWKPLSPDYGRWKALNFPGRPLLVRTGEMRAAFTRSNARGSLGRVTKRKLVYGVTGEAEQRAQRHQYGEGSMPARPILAIPLRDRRQIERIFATWLNDIRRGNFGSER